MRFNDIIGQRAVINKLIDIADSGRVAHAMLLLGQNGYGSLAMALAFAQYLNCQNRQHYGDGHDLHGDSCGECPSCKKMQQLVHPDLHFSFPTAPRSSSDKTDSLVASMYVEDFRNWVLKREGYGSYDDWMTALGVEKKQGQMRAKDAVEILRNISMKSYEAPYKMVIVWMADKMNITCANDLLKTLEEPTPNTVIMLVAENREDILPTIISRTQLISLPPIDNQSLVNAVQMRENIIGKESEVVSAADGDFMAALNYLDSENPEREYSELFVQWMRRLFKLNMAPLSQWVDEVHAWGNRDKQKKFLMFAQDAFRACFLKTVAGLELTYRLQFGDEKFNNAFPNMITHNNIEAICSALDEAIYAIERNAYAKLVFMKLSFTLSSLLKKG